MPSSFLSFPPFCFCLFLDFLSLFLEFFSPLWLDWSHFFAYIYIYIYFFSRSSFPSSILLLFLRPFSWPLSPFASSFSLAICFFSYILSFAVLCLSGHKRSKTLLESAAASSRGRQISGYAVSLYDCPTVVKKWQRHILDHGFQGGFQPWLPMMTNSIFNPPIRWAQRCDFISKPMDFWGVSGPSRKRWTSLFWCRRVGRSLRCCGLWDRMRTSHWMTSRWSDDRWKTTGWWLNNGGLLGLHGIQSKYL